MTIFEARVILGIDPDGDFIPLSDLRDIRERIEADRETAKGSAKRRLTRRLEACDKVIAWKERGW